jgi:5-methylcytosine-specific restriction protein A
MPIRKLCAYVGCSALVGKDERYCPKHREKAEREKQTDRKADAPWYEKLERKNEQYQTSRWRAESANFLRLNGICSLCGEKATEVHHAIPPRGEDELFWDKSNWVALCHNCHQRITLSEMAERRKKNKEDAERNRRIKRLWY